MIDFLKKTLDNKVFRFIIAVIAAVVMYYTPDEIDRIILGILSFFGITPLILAPFGKDK